MCVYGGLLAETYLGSVDCAVERVVLLIVQQAEIQRPQRGCKRKEAAISLSPRKGLLPGYGLVGA